MYDRYVKQKDSNGNGNEFDLPASRILPNNEHLHEQTVEACHSLLVGTGVYKHKPESDRTTTETSETGKHVYHGHRDIAHDFHSEPELSKPHKYCHDVDEGIQYVLRTEGL